MTKVKAAGIERPTTPSEKLKQIVMICEAAQDDIDDARLVQKGALDAAQESHGFEPAAVRRLLAWRRQKAKDPTKRASMDELDDQYRFMCEGGAGEMPEKADDDIDRVIALSSTGLASIAAIKGALKVSQGTASKLRSMAAARMAYKAQIGERVEKIASSSSREIDELELPAHDAVTGEVIEPPRPSVLPCATIWQEVTGTREEHIAERELERAAATERRRVERLAQATEAARVALLTGDDMPDFPPGFDRRQTVSA